MWIIQLFCFQVKHLLVGIITIYQKNLHAHLQMLSKKTSRCNADNFTIVDKYGWPCTGKQNISIKQNYTKKTNPYAIVEITYYQVIVDPNFNTMHLGLEKIEI